MPGRSWALRLGCELSKHPLGEYLLSQGRLQVDLVDVAEPVQRAPHGGDQLAIRAGPAFLVGQAPLAGEEEIAAIGREARAVVAGHAVDPGAEVLEWLPDAVLAPAHEEGAVAETVGMAEGADQQKALVRGHQGLDVDPAGSIDRISQVFRLCVVAVHQARAPDVDSALASGAIRGEIERAVAGAGGEV